MSSFSDRSFADRSFSDRLAERVASVGVAACMGLDPHLDRVPGTDRHADRAHNAAAVRSFCLAAIDAVADVMAVVKPQSAFFEALGAPGVEVLEAVVAHAQAAGLLVLLDAKRGDIGSTAEAYAEATLDDAGPMGADAVTLSPYLGPESLHPFAQRIPAGKGLFVLVRTSNPGAGPWQRDLGLAEAVASWVVEHPEGVGAVVGATLPVHEVHHWRARLPDTWLLVPGYGAQGAGVQALRPFFAGPRVRALAAAARSVLFAPAGAPAADQGAAGIRSRAQAFADDVRTAGG